MANVPPVFADPALLERVVTTLLLDTVRVAPRGAAVLVKVHAAPQGDRVDVW